MQLGRVRWLLKLAVWLLAGYLLTLVLCNPALGKSVESVQSGAWNDPATWSNGVPGAGTRVMIGAGHTISIPSPGVICGQLETRATNKHWSTITGNGRLTIAAGGKISFVAFQNQGGVRVPLAAGGRVLFDHCTFSNTGMLGIGTAQQTPLSSAIMVRNCDFRGVFGSGNQRDYIVKINGRRGRHSGELRIIGNTFVGINGGQGLRIERRDGAEITGNVFVDSSILQLDEASGTTSVSGGHLIQGNLFAHIHDTERKRNHRVVYVIPFEEPLEFVGNYIYDLHWNDHTITGGSTLGDNKIIDNIFEYGPDTTEANAIALPAVSLLVEDNILKGSATLVSNVGNHEGSRPTIVRRNIVYNTAKIVPGLFLSENGLPSYPLHFEENIVVGGRYAFFHNGNPPGRAVIALSDANHFWQVETPYHLSITVTSGKQHDTVDQDLGLPDPSRGFLAYYAHISGRKVGDPQVVAQAFAGKNGYDPLTGGQGSPDSTFTPERLHQWVAAGFRKEERR